MSKKRSRDASNNTTETEMHTNNKNSLQKNEPANLQNITPVCILCSYYYTYTIICNKLININVLMNTQSFTYN